MDLRRACGVLVVAAALGTSTGCSGSSTDAPIEAVSSTEPEGVTDALTTVVAPTSTSAAPAATTTTPPAATTTTVAREVIPIIDEENSVLSIIRSREDLKRFAALVEAVGADRVFRQERGVTILAPNDEAWGAMTDEVWTGLLADPDAAALVVAEYLSIGSASVADLVAAGTFQNATTRSLVVLGGDPVTIDGVPLVDADLAADNGYVHVLGGLLPASTP